MDHGYCKIAPDGSLLPTRRVLSTLRAKSWADEPSVESTPVVMPAWRVFDNDELEERMAAIRVRLALDWPEHEKDPEQPGVRLSPPAWAREIQELYREGVPSSRLAELVPARAGIRGRPHRSRRCSPRGG